MEEEEEWFGTVEELVSIFCALKEDWPLDVQSPVLGNWSLLHY